VEEVEKRVNNINYSWELRRTSERGITVLLMREIDHGGDSFFPPFAFFVWLCASLIFSAILLVQRLGVIDIIT
jgi:hypothetical protein